MKVLLPCLLLLSMTACASPTTISAPVTAPVTVSPPSVDPSAPAASAVKLKPGMTFYWQLNGTLGNPPKTDVIDFDLEDNESNGMIAKFKAQGRIVMCYFSGGTYENWRSDKSKFPSSVIGKALGDWPGENWLNVRSGVVRSIMSSRIARAKAAGCHGIEPDNMDLYDQKTGFTITKKDTLDYMKFLTDEAHKNGLLIGLKNAGGVAEQVVGMYDFELNEQCNQYNECGELRPFIQAGKPVFIAEYQSLKQAWCDKAKKEQMSLAFFNVELNGKKFQPCP